MDFAVPADYGEKFKESKNIDKYLDLAQEKLWNMRVTVIPIVVGALGKKTGVNENQRKNQNHANHSIVKIS